MVRFLTPPFARPFAPSALIALLLIGGCTAPEPNPEEVTESPSNAETEFPASGTPITLTPLPPAPSYPEAHLTLTSPPLGNAVPPGTTTFEFEVDSFELGVQTTDAGERGIADSGDGQHIHFILDNGPYSALYDPQHQAKLEPGAHVVLAFLSRSYHESVKQAGAFVAQEFLVGDGAQPAFDRIASHLFYSRPKGIYKGADARSVMLDFFLLNAELGPGKNTVLATINGQNFTISEWQPYAIRGLPLGENTVTLELRGPDGSAIASPYNPVSRTFELVE